MLDFKTQISDLLPFLQGLQTASVILSVKIHVLKRGRGAF